MSGCLNLDTFIIPGHSGDFFPETPEDYLKILKSDFVYDWPARLDIDITNRCNHICHFCFSKTYRLSSPECSMGFPIIKKIIKEMVLKGTISVRFCGGGEPLMHPEAYNIFKYCLGFPVHITLLTNGDLFSNEYQRIFLRPFVHLRFSLDSYNETTRAKLHGTSIHSFNIVVNNITNYNNGRYKESIVQSTKVGVTYLLHPLNIDGICNISEKMKNIGVDYITFRLIKGNISIIFSAEELKRLVDNFRKAKHKYEDEAFKLFFPTDFNRTTFSPHSVFDKCLVSRVRTMIEANGNVQMCPKGRGGISWKTIGNIIQESSFVSIWNVNKRSIQFQRAPKECVECLDYSSNKTLNGLLNHIYNGEIIEFLRLEK
ncbi:MAG: radical SAM protein [Deltaproteobacteria bacterium]|nr:radical SAM protein [Deltaproteobacteria bacterium]